jgi:regulator of protease activity HflC (stomatin/prohibitin superfamily)
MDRTLDSNIGFPRRRRALVPILVIVAVIGFLMGGPFRTVPAGHVGVKDFFGQVSPALPAGIRIVFPFTRVVKISVQTQEIKEVAEVPSKEG